MIAGVADTHAAVWYLFGDPRLSPGAKSFIDQAAASRRTIEISPISLAKVVYLLEKKNRLPASAFDSLRGALVNPKHVFKEAPLTGDVVKAMQLIPREGYRTCRTGSSRRPLFISGFRSSAATGKFARRMYGPSGRLRVPALHGWNI